MVYKTLNAAAQQLDPQLSAAEAHGMAAGMLCANVNALSSYWLDGLASASNESSQLLVHVFEETRRLLRDEEFEFDLLLPDDDVILTDRVVALAAWCQGFLFGVGSANVASACSSEANGILRDITEITKIDNRSEGEEDELAYVEITEYLRAAVLVLRDEFWGDTRELAS